MAQRTIHMLFAVLLADKLELKDKNRFFLGSLLPDAYINQEDRQISHFIKYISDENCLYFDFYDFSMRFNNKVLTDELYLGYYAHLIEDAFYRYYLYYEKEWLAKIKSYKLDILYKDYQVLNSYISQKYKMPTHIEIPSNYSNEALNEITTFDIHFIIRNYKNDITEKVNMPTEMLTEKMLEEFISKYIDIISDELLSVQNGKSTLNAIDYKWKNKNK